MSDNNNETSLVSFKNSNALPPIPPIPSTLVVVISDEEINSTVEWLKQHYEEYLPEFADCNNINWLRSSSNHVSSGNPGYWDWSNMYIINSRLISNSAQQKYSQNMRRVATFAIYYGEHNDEHYRMPRHSYYRYASLVKRYHDNPPCRSQ